METIATLFYETGLLGIVKFKTKFAFASALSLHYLLIRQAAVRNTFAQKQTFGLPLHSSFTIFG